jgi:hypothetical protein
LCFFWRDKKNTKMELLSDLVSWTTHFILSQMCLKLKRGLSFRALA